jgi:hypothetical protein
MSPIGSTFRTCRSGSNIQLSRADRSKLKAVVVNRNSPRKHVWRAKIVVLMADRRGTAEIMQATGKGKTVCMTSATEARPA